MAETTFNGGQRSLGVRYSAFTRRLAHLGRFVLLLGVEGLIRTGRRATARRVMQGLIARSPVADDRTLHLVARAWAGRASSGRISELRAVHLDRLIKRPIKEKNYARLLYLAARYEALGKGWPIAAGDLIARQIVSDNGRRRLRDASAKALELAPDSTFLIYLNAVTTAKCGDPVAAGQALSGHIARLTTDGGDSAGKPAAVKRRFDVLRAAWRVVDLIAREEMQWLDDQRGKSYAGFGKADAPAVPADASRPVLHFNEPLLQARAAEAYLRSCRLDFDAAATLVGKLKAIKEMLREGVRRQLSYHAAYAAAGECYDTVRDELAAAHAEALAGPDDQRGAQIVQALTLALDLCRRMRRASEVLVLKQRVLEISRLESFRKRRWALLGSIVVDDDAEWLQASLDLRAGIETPPATEGDLKSFLKWAMAARQFADAETVFDRLERKLQGSEAALYFVNILQRQSRFTEALRLTRTIHARMLARPAAIKPWIHWNLVRRHGELDFLRKTSTLFMKVPQPRDPIGVVLLAARNVDQLRKYPLVALMMMKKRGWAVAPLVEGLLPRERTGDPDIDLLVGCVSIENAFVPAAAAKIPEIEDFHADPARGVLRWGAIDLGHSLLEDARIGRRAYNVDLTCPALVNNQDRLARSTALFARAIRFAHERLAAKGKRGALLSLFNSRLPDSLFRFYCDEHGDPDKFFCLHTTNGYENYFRNFKTSISTRCVIRNVTRHKEVRGASMPIPAYFEQYFQAHKPDVGGILERLASVGDVRRTTGGVASADPEAAAFLDRVRAWRARGGKVVCMFGRVVCDSAVPFDGGPAHADLADWVNHTIEAVRDSNTLLVIKPHPHELNESIGTYLNEYFVDLIRTELPDNVLVMGHRWFDIQSLKKFVDLGLVYNGTTAMELALQEIPTVVTGHFAPIDYPVGNVVPRDKTHYEQLVRFETEISPNPEAKARAAIWLQYMSMSGFVIDYRYHARPVTNRVVYPPYWIESDLEQLTADGDVQAAILADRAIGAADEPRA